MKRPFESLPSAREAIDLWVLMALFGMLVSLIGITGYSTFSYQKSGIKKQLQEHLATVADLKVGQIDAFLVERRNDAEALAANPIWKRLGTSAGRLASDVLELFEALAESTRKHMRVRKVFLLDPDGELWTAPGFTHVTIATATRSLAQVVCRHGVASISPFVPSVQNGSETLVFDIMAPLPRHSGELTAPGVLVFRLDPKDFLFPLVERWPTVSRSAETLLVTTDGDNVVFLTSLRHRQEGISGFRLSSALQDLPAARVVRGEEGVVEGIDYRGVAVLAALRKVAGMPWYMVAKIDQDEIYQPIWTQALFIGVGSLLLVSVGIGVLLLISGRHRENERLASEERLRVSQEIAAVGTWDWDLATNRQIWSDQLFRLFGLSPGQIEPSHEELVKRIHAEDVQRVKAAIVAALSRGEDFQVEHRILRENGERRYVLEQGQVYRDGTGQPVRMIGVAWDTTERIRSQREYQSIIRAALDGFWLCDMRGRFLEVNDAYCAMTGYSRDELLMMSIPDVEVNERPEETARHIHRIIETGYSRFETRHRTKDGSLLDLEVSVKFLDIEDGRMFVFLRDIGPRKQFEKDLIIARDEAERANRAKSSFLANMSHEIRTPMNAILGFTQLMLRDQGLATQQRMSLESIAMAGEHLLALINDILEMSRIEAGRLELRLGAFAAADLLQHLEAMFGGRARMKGIAFRIEGADRLPEWITSDEGKLRQVLLNLLGNAFKFTHRGEIVLAFALVQSAQEEARRGGVYRFEVRDSGPGLSADEIGLLFKPFSQTRVGIEAKGGTGLGLAISNEYVRLLGGSLQVESTSGRGSRFWFEIPLKAAEDAPVTKPGRGRVVGLEPGQPRLRILNVDDEAMNREILRRMLEVIPCEMQEAADGRKTLELVESFRPDLILMDLAMPHLGGEEAIRQIRARPENGKIVIIALTAMAFEEDRRRILEAGASEYLRKPFRENDLFEAIGRLLNLRFRYASTEHAPTRTVAEAREAIPLLRGRVPDDLVARVAKAAVELDPEQLGILFDEVARHDPETGKLLCGCLERYDFEAIQRWAEGSESR